MLWVNKRKALIAAFAAGALMSPAASYGAFTTVALSGEDIDGAPGGLRFGDTFGQSPLLNNAGQVLINGGVTGDGVDDTNGWALFTGSVGGGLELTLRQGDAAGVPAGQIGAFASTLKLNQNGDWAVLGRQQSDTNLSPFNFSAIYASDGQGGFRVVAAGDAVSPQDGRAYEGRTRVFLDALSGQNDIGYRDRLDQPGGNPGGFQDEFSFGGDPSSPTVISGPGMPSPITGKQYTQLGVLSVINENGLSAFAADVANPDFSGNQRSLFLRQLGSGSTTVVASTDETAPGLPDAIFSRLDQAAINNAGYLLFHAQLEDSDPFEDRYNRFDDNDQALYLRNPNGDLILVAHESGEVPGGLGTFQNDGGIFNAFGSTVLNGRGDLAFTASLDFERNDAIFIRRADGEYVVLAQDGVTLTDGTVITGVPRVRDNHALALNDLGQIVFEAFADGNESLIAGDVFGDLSVLVSVGDEMLLSDGSTGIISGLDFAGANGGHESGNLTGLNDLGQVLFEARFEDGRSGIFLVTIPEPASLTIALLGGVLIVARRRRG